MSMGLQSLNQAVQDAEPYPIQGLFRFKGFFDDIDAYYHMTHGHEYRHVSTGWKTLDKFYTGFLVPERVSGLMLCYAISTIVLLLYALLNRGHGTTRSRQETFGKSF